MGYQAPPAMLRAWSCRTETWPRGWRRRFA